MNEQQPFLECPVWGWFELSYAAYLVVPRLVLQSMPHEWKARFVDLLNEMEESVDGYEAPEYAVFVRDKDGRLSVEDERVRKYRHGEHFPLLAHRDREAEAGPG